MLLWRFLCLLLKTMRQDYELRIIKEPEQPEDVTTKLHPHFPDIYQSTSRFNPSFKLVLV
jgi:hypothetical protein